MAIPRVSAGGLEAKISAVSPGAPASTRRNLRVPRRSLAYRMPFLFKMKFEHPALDVRHIQVASLYADNACGILQLPIRTANLRPLQFGNEHVLGRGDVHLTSTKIDQPAARKCCAAVLGFFRYDEVHLPAAGMVNDVELASVRQSLQRQRFVSVIVRAGKFLH
jgi:hypothetical protein